MWSKNTTRNLYRRNHDLWGWLWDLLSHLEIWGQEEGYQSKPRHPSPRSCSPWSRIRAYQSHLRANCHWWCKSKIYPFSIRLLIEWISYSGPKLTKVRGHPNPSSIYSTPKTASRLSMATTRTLKTSGEATSSSKRRKHRCGNEFSRRKKSMTSAWLIL